VRENSIFGVFLDPPQNPPKIGQFVHFHGTMLVTKLYVSIPHDTYAILTVTL